MLDADPSWRQVTALSIAMMLGVSILYAFAVPALRGPDEHSHLDYVVHIEETHEIPDVGERVRQTPAAPTLQQLYASRRNSLGPFRAATAVPRSERPAVGDSLPREAVIHMAQHPPGYYLLGAAWDQVLHGMAPGQALDARALGMRLLSLALFVATTVLVLVGARDLGLRPKEGLFAVLLLLLSPMWGFMGAMANNDDLLIASCAAAMVMGIRVLEGDRRRSTALVFGIVVAVACLTKVMGLIMVPWVGLVHLVTMMRHGRRPVEQAKLLAPTALVVALGAGWWWVRNLVVYGRLQPHTFRALDIDPTTLRVFDWLREFVPWTIVRFWGLYGGTGSGLAAPTTLAIIGTGLLVILWVVGFIRSDPRTRAVMLVLSAVLVVVVIASVQVGWNNYQRLGVTRTQGRYYLFAMPAAVLAITAGLGRARLLRRRLAVVVAVGVVVANGQALAQILDRYWSGGGVADVPGTVLAWSPWPGAVTFLFLLAGVVSMVSIPVITWRSFPARLRPHLRRRTAMATLAPGSDG